MKRIKKASKLVTYSGSCSPHTFKNKTITLCSKFYRGEWGKPSETEKPILKWSHFLVLNYFGIKFI